MQKNKKMVTVRFDQEFVRWFDVRAKAERMTRTALLEKVGWNYLRSHFKKDQDQLVRINQVLNNNQLLAGGILFKETKNYEKKED